MRQNDMKNYMFGLEENKKEKKKYSYSYTRACLPKFLLNFLCFVRKTVVLSNFDINLFSLKLNYFLLNFKTFKHKKKMCDFQILHLFSTILGQSHIWC